MYVRLLLSLSQKRRQEMEGERERTGGRVTGREGERGWNKEDEAAAGMPREAVEGSRRERQGKRAQTDVRQ